MTSTRTSAEVLRAARAMSDNEKRLARHALGLPNEMGRSYRNRFFAGNLHRRIWAGMKAAGWADAETSCDRTGMRWFWLTPAGALLALEPSETLCPEDFPTVTLAEAQTSDPVLAERESGR